MSIVLHDNVKPFITDEEIIPKKSIKVDDYAKPVVLVLPVKHYIFSLWIEDELPMTQKPLSLIDGGIWWATIFKY